MRTNDNTVSTNRMFYFHIDFNYYLHELNEILFFNDELSRRSLLASKANRAQLVEASKLRTHYSQRPKTSDFQEKLLITNCDLVYWKLNCFQFQVLRNFDDLVSTGVTEELVNAGVKVKDHTQVHVFLFCIFIISHLYNFFSLTY